MRRSLLILAAALVVCTAVVSASYFVARQCCARLLTNPADDLEWLRSEFHLSDAELQHVRQLHEGYLPQCRAICAHIAVKKQELQAEFAASTNHVTPAVEQTLQDIAVLRAQCQAQMLQHFQEVSQTMPPAEGRRYLAEMQRLTLGFHEQFENRMSGPAHEHEHGHH
jgi:hypothetical protein